jgi:hypothetical protein
MRHVAAADETNFVGMKQSVQEVPQQLRQQARAYDPSQDFRCREHPLPYLP